MDKAEYLRKYLGIGRLKKVKKKKKEVAAGRGLRIIDDDADVARVDSEVEDDETDEKPIVIQSPERQVNTKLTTKNWLVQEAEGRKAKRHDSSASDASPPRPAADGDSDLAPLRKQTVRHDSDSDLSLSRKATSINSKDVDLSPPRKRKETSGNEMIKKENIKEEANDQSPPRRRRRQDSSPDISPVRERGVQRVMKRDIRRVEVISKHNNEKEKSLKMKQERKEEEERKKKAFSDKYKEWGRGLKQQEKHKEMLQDMQHEANKPLARYQDDDDLNEMRRNRLLKEDPMFGMMMQKQMQVKNDSKLIYTGPLPHANRFDIDPGYRWDGVDRSNGFEEEFFRDASNRKAVKDIAYKYMTEDM